MDQNMVNFTLHFESTLKPQQLGRGAGEKDSLEGTFMQDCEYENFMFNPEEPVLPCVDFLLDGDEKIITGLSSGKRDKTHSICLLPIRLCVLIKAVCKFL